MQWREFANDFDAIAIDDAPPPPADAEMMMELRAAALSKRLDLTDAFEAYAGAGRDAGVGVMAKNRFHSAMREIFKGVDCVNYELLDRIALAYGCGDPDPREPGEFLQVQFRRFAREFDAITPPEIVAPPMDEQLKRAMGELKKIAVRRRLDMSEGFEEYAMGDGCSVDYNEGVMARSRFCSSLQCIVPGAALSQQLLDTICAAYPAGDRDPVHGGHLKARLAMHGRTQLTSRASVTANPRRAAGELAALRERFR